MTLTEARKQALARRFGTSCSVTEYSPIKAMDDDLAGTFTLYIDDMKWLMDATGENVANCGVTTPTTTKTGINFSTGEVDADVYLNGIKIGKSNEFIETGAGLKTFELRAEGYNTRTVTENVTEGNILNRSYTLYKPSTTTTPDDTTPAQPVLIEGEGGVPLTVEIVMEGGKPVTSQPLEVDVGVAQWYSIMVKNTGDTPWKGYVGVKFTDSTGRTWTKTPEKQYAQTVAPGDSKSIKTSVSIPQGSITEGNVAVTMLLRGYR